ncbi:preprotein translocase subunit SecA [Candidatus Dojkabacteria bacterium]|nr:preprotein translocase subunit SecA [Candidatus Dojkabacteria bacterium]
MQMFSFIKKLFDHNSKELENVQAIVNSINELAPEMKKLSDAELAESTTYFRKKYGFSQGKPLTAEENADLKKHLLTLIPEVFARVREVSDRVAKHRQFDVQLMGGVFLAQNKVIELFTGEGKTNVAPLAAYLYGLLGYGVHIVTVNDYLAKRDAEWVGHILYALGMSVAVITPQAAYKFVPDAEAISKNGDEVKALLKEKDLSIMASLRGANLIEVTKREAYECDITYGTSSEFGFDYLRDNMARSLSQKVQRGHFYSIVDECDSILIDEARTPLIISAPAAKSNELYVTFAKLVKGLKRDTDYTVDEKDRDVYLTEEGIAKVEKLLAVKNLWENFELAHHLENALKAEVLFTRDDDYIVASGQVQIVDEFTGRVLSGRRYSEGLHQAIEAKEGVEIKKESKTMATISYQNFFRMYDFLSGMTGTAATEAEEFADIYKLDVVVVPTYKGVIRKDYPDVVYKTLNAKLNAVVTEVEEYYSQGRPVLVGTGSVEVSEVVSSLLMKKGVPHNVLNAKNHEKEALIVAKAGEKGAVTVATNMAGRGTDIKLGEGVKELGGLHIVGTQRHEARRIDNQLRGRSGRLGDPGSSRFFVSLEDELMRRFGGDMMKGMLDRMGVDENLPIESGFITKAIQSAQKKVEGHNFEIRKHLVEYDDVLNNHRGIIYSLRDALISLLDKDKEIHSKLNDKQIRQRYKDLDLDRFDFDQFEIFVNEFSILGENQSGWDDLFGADNLVFLPVRKWILQKVTQKIKSAFTSSFTADATIDKDESTKLTQNMFLLIPENLLDIAISEIGFKNRGDFESSMIEKKEMQEKLNLAYKLVLRVFTNYYQEFYKVANDIERVIILSTIDKLWIDHLDAMRVLREGISLRGYAQRNPLIEYKNEGYNLFNELLLELADGIASRIFRVQRVSKPLPSNSLVRNAIANTLKTMKDKKEKDKKSEKTPQKETKSDPNRPGRNDPCPCGSGKKYKKCCYPNFG